MLRNKTTWLLLGLTASCAAPFHRTADPIRGEDRGTAELRVRGAIPLGEADERGRRDSLELSATRATGGFEQTLTSGDDIRLKGEWIAGPGELDATFELTTASVLYHHRVDTGSRLRLAALAGVTLTELDLRVSAGAQRDAASRVSVGPTLGGQLDVDLGADVTAFARLTWNAAFSGGDVSGTSLLDVGATLKPWEQAGLSLGWRLGRYELERDATSVSDIELDYGGPFVTLEVGAGGR